MINNVERIELKSQAAKFVTYEPSPVEKGEYTTFMVLSMIQLRQLKVDIEKVLSLHEQNQREAAAQRFKEAKTRIADLEAQLAEEREFVRKFQIGQEVNT